MCLSLYTIKSTYQLTSVPSGVFTALLTLAVLHHARYVVCSSKGLYFPHNRKLTAKNLSLTAWHEKANILHNENFPLYSIVLAVDMILPHVR